MLRFNGSPFGYLTPCGGYLLANNLAKNARDSKVRENSAAFGKKVSIPQGFTAAERAIVPSISSTDFIRCVLQGSGDLATSGVFGEGSISATLVGVGTLTPDSEMGATLGATITGVGSLQGTARGVGSLAVTIDAGARPSAFDISQEVWQAKAAGFPDPTTMGGKVNAAGTAGDPWGADISGYPPGTAGYSLYSLDPQELANAIMNDPRLLTVAKFLGLK